MQSVDCRHFKKNPSFVKKKGTLSRHLHRITCGKSWSGDHVESRFFLPRRPGCPTPGTSITPDRSLHFPPGKTIALPRNTGSRKFLPAASGKNALLPPRDFTAGCHGALPSFSARRHETKEAATRRMTASFLKGVFTRRVPKSRRHQSQTRLSSMGLICGGRLPGARMRSSGRSLMRSRNRCWSSSLRLKLLAST